MPSLLIRNVPDETISRLKRQAKNHGRSLQSEALAVLQGNVPYSGDAVADQIERLRSEGKLDFDVDAALAALYEDRQR